MPQNPGPGKEQEEEIAKLLICEGEKQLNNPPDYIEFTYTEPADTYLNDLKNHPHHFLLACIMTPQIRANRAFGIPCQISEKIGGYAFKSFLKTSKEEFINIFQELSLHCFNERCGRTTSLVIQRIAEEYDGNAANIWSDNPSSCAVVRRMLEFYGAGIKVATMTANVLARDFRVPMSDMVCIDVSPDVHVKRVFLRLGLINENDGPDVLIYKARELNPKYPGIFDLSC
ncbi:hypothetical protein [Methanolacinia petrolearia]|uniref:hypothetical protein n=1 Tax=Methanolacinia petrolearia TaxID=54120 RepID=UPI000A0255A0|nr:hypothetical protein [Methanolacinia petrolearia]